jgi:putative oligomerization/nucleic acid binding protein
MLLVPRQLRRAGMTGDVPYYGGRMSPAQAYAVTHSGRPPQSVYTAVDVVGRTARPPAPAPSHEETLASLQHLLDSGVITNEEYEQLRARVTA